MPLRKRYYDQKKLVIQSFDNYIVAATALFIARQAKDKITGTVLENNLDKMWEEWQLASSNLNHLLLIESKSF